ncbi:MAG: hypothetical protein M3146_06960 [Thermoproteota archaeon]|nr:hypothetical protein [Thermoproteota archaeon]
MPKSKSASNDGASSVITVPRYITEEATSADGAKVSCEEVSTVAWQSYNKHIASLFCRVG